MNDFLGIELIAGLNEVQSKKKINNTVKSISKRLEPLKIKLDIDEKALQTIRNFNKEMQKLSQASEKTGQSVKQAMSPAGSSDLRQHRLKELINETQRLEHATKKQSQSAEDANRKEAQSVSDLLKQYTVLNKVAEKRNKAGEITEYRYDVGDDKGHHQTSIYATPDGKILRSQNVASHDKMNKELERVANERQKIYRKLADIEREYASELNKDTMTRFSKQVEQGDLASLGRMSKNIDEYRKHLGRERAALQKSNREMDSLTAQRQDIFRKLANIHQTHGSNVNQKTMAMFDRQVIEGDKNSLKELSRNVDDYGKSMANLQKLQHAQREASYKVIRLHDSTFGAISPEHQKAIDRYLGGINRLTKDTPNLQSELRRLNSEFAQTSHEVLQADQGMARFSRQMASAMFRIPIYAAGMAAMYAPLRMFQDAISQSIEIDSQITVLERVSNGTIQMNQALEDSIGIAERLGNTISEVNDGLINFARQGYRDEDLSAITEVATVMSNVSDLTVEDAASGLTAAMKGFNIEAENSIHIVNAMNEVDNNYSITTQQLAESIQRSAGAAQTYGATMERTIGKKCCRCKTSSN